MEIKWNKLNLVVYLILPFTCHILYNIAYRLMQLLSYGIYMYHLTLIIFGVILLKMFFIILCFIPSPKLNLSMQYDIHGLKTDGQKHQSCRKY